MSIEPTAPIRPLRWPPFVERLSQVVSDPARVFLVGGVVRDALRGQDVHDFDLTTPDSGRSVARHIADKLGGKYYALDAERNIGRAIVEDDGRSLVIDVASFRGGTLLDDLGGRDFTINAMATSFDQLDAIIDPLGGQADLFTARILRQCSEASISDDPVRAIRAIRHSLQFGLRMAPELIASAKAARVFLFTTDRLPAQPERIRDELFKLLTLANPASALRIANRLGLLEPLGLFATADNEAVDFRLSVVEALAGLMSVISPRRDDNTASSLTLGTAVMILDRHRAHLQAHLSAAFTEERQRAALLCVAAAAPPGTVDWRAWASTYCLSNLERRELLDLDSARIRLANLPDAADRREVYRYFKGIKDAGVDGILLLLSEFLASNQPTPDAIQWGDLLDHTASPLIDAYFNRYDDQIAPAPLLSGDDMQRLLGLEPGPTIGTLIDGLVEEQAAGAIETQKEALQFVKRLLKQQPS